MRRSNYALDIFQHSKREAIGVAILFLLLAGGAWLGVRQKISLSPRHQDFDRGVTLNFEATDNDQTTTLLDNNLVSCTPGNPNCPDYTDTDDPPELLQKDGNGVIRDLFRIEGNIDYR